MAKIDDVIIGDEILSAGDTHKFHEKILSLSKVIENFPSGGGPRTDVDVRKGGLYFIAFLPERI